MNVPPPPEPAVPRRAGTTGTVLVVAQLALIVWIIALAAPALWRWLVQGMGPASMSTSLLGAVLLGLGTALGLWALWANRPGNFNIRPDPRAGAQMVMHGPYRWMRHPMYTALMLACAGLVAVAASFWAAAAWLVMVGVLDRKARIEEALMAQTHPGYAAYAARTGRFLPGVV